MVSKCVCTDAEGAMQYFDDHLNAADYFVSEQSSERGHYIGAVAKRLGLETVTRENFKAFVENDMVALGASPDSGRQRVSDIKYMEFTYTPPKAVGVAAALDDRIQAELYAAVKDEFKWFEQQASVRDRRGDLASQKVSRPTGEMLAALFQHETSRTNDPNFHVHGLIANVTWDAERGGYFAMDYGNMLELRKTLDARIHNNLAGRLTQLGYTVEAAPSGFGLKEVSRQTEDLFSERSKQVKLVKELFQQGYTPKQLADCLKPLSESEKRRVLAAPGELSARLGKPLGGIRLSAHELDQQAVTLTRPKKIKITSQNLREEVSQRLQAAGQTVVIPESRSLPLPLPTSEELEQAMNAGIESVFERESVVRLDELVGEIVRLSPGTLTNEELTQRLRDDQRFLIRRVEGLERITTRAILAEERTLLTAVARQMDSVGALHSVETYQTPAALALNPTRVKEMLADAQKKGEELSPDQAAQWLAQFSAIHKYVCTSKDRFVNIRGGAGVGKTFAMELLVEESLQGGRSVVLCAPYGEQSRVTMRAEAPRLAEKGKTAVAAAFQEANTVDYLLIKARTDENYLAGLRGADIYVDEAGLLDTPKALQLVRLAETVEARVIFQGDTEQMAAVGRGQPIKLLQEQVGLGMHVERASISRRQKKSEDKQLAADLSSGDENKFAVAVQRMMSRGMIRETSTQEAVEKVAQEIISGRATGKDVVAVSSVHRIAEQVSDRVHQLHVEKYGDAQTTSLAVHIKRDLKAQELKSSQFYQVGDVVEFKPENNLIRGKIIGVDPNHVLVEGFPSPLPFKEVRAIYEAKEIKRSPGEVVVLQEKVKIGFQIYEKGSRQKIQSVTPTGEVKFESGLILNKTDGRIRQGDCLTDYKSQGIKGASVRGIEDNGSVVAMANKEAFHVKGTRHVSDLEIHVENKALFAESIRRSNRKFSALELATMDGPIQAVERVKAKESAVIFSSPQKSEVLERVQEWGRDSSRDNGAKVMNTIKTRPKKSRMPNNSVQARIRQRARQYVLEVNAVRTLQQIARKVEQTFEIEMEQ